MNLEHFKTKLLSQQEKLKKEIDYYSKEDPFKSEIRETEVFDESVTEIEEHDRIAATVDRLKNDLYEVSRALERIEKGTYGICKSCGEKIEEERLEAFPTATTCLSCQKKFKE